MTYAYLVAASILFVELVVRLDFRRDARRVAARSREALSVIASAETDDVKAAWMRRASLDVLRGTLGLCARIGVIAAVLGATWWAVVAMSPALGHAILEKSVSPAVVVALTLVASAYGWLRHVVLERL